MPNFTTTLCWIDHDKSSFYLASMVRAWKVFISKKYVQKTHRTTVKNTKMKNRKWLGSDQLMSREGGEGRATTFRSPYGIISDIIDQYSMLSQLVYR